MINSTTSETAMMKKIRAVRLRGKKQITAVNERLNAAAWDLASGNADVNDAHVNKAIAILDEALECLQVAVALLNTVAVSPPHPQETQPQETQSQEGEGQETQPQETQPQETQPQETQSQDAPSESHSVIPIRDKKAVHEAKIKAKTVLAMPLNRHQDR